jgi:PAS domain S-box-containing protein
MNTFPNRRSAGQPNNPIVRQTDFERYGALFESMGNGFCVIEKIESPSGKLLDFCFVQANPAFEMQTGLRDVVGRTLSQVLPIEFEERLLTYGRLLETGESRRSERAFALENRVVELHAFRLDGESRAHVAISVQDITERKRAEEVLRQRTDQFETLFSEAPLGIFMIDADFRVFQANPLARCVWPSTPELIGRDFGELMHALWPKAMADRIVERYRRTLATGESFATPEIVEKRLDHLQTEYYESHINRIPLPDGSHGVVCYFRDISERVLGQQKSLKSQERYRSLFNSIDEGFCVIELIFDEQDKAVDYRFLEVNPAFEKQTGLANATGKRVRELVQDHEMHWVNIYSQVVATGESIRFVNQAKGVDGSWFDVHAGRVGGPESRMVALLFNNITERKHAEDELRASNERMQMATQATGVGIWEWNVPANTIWWDTQMFEIYGLAPTPDGLVPYSAWSSCVVPEDLANQEAVLHGTIIRGGYGKRDFRIRRASDGVCRHIEAGETVRNNSDGKPEWVVGTNLDITERSQLQQEALQQAQTLIALDHRKDEFLAMLGHELRNPLAAIANALQLQNRQAHEAPLQRQTHAIIERQVGQLTHLVDDLLEVSRITSGSVRLRKQPTDIGAVVQRAVETVEPVISPRRHALKLSLPSQPLVLQVDTARLEQVLVNLLSNAAKYTDEGGCIWLSVESEGDSVAIRVRDNGIGIAPELLPHIFELFTQAERSMDRSQGGLGIGLSLVRQLVELHGGTVAAASVPGQGSEFVVRLPAMTAESVPIPVPLIEASESAASEATACRVLVVDDNVDAAQGLASLLEIIGHQVRIAYDGPSAVAAAIDYQPDVVLLDIGLPGLDGYQVAQRIRQQDSLKSVVLAALTGYGQDADRQRSHDAGFNHHLTKPANFEDIEKILMSVSPLVT